MLSSRIKSEMQKENISCSELANKLGLSIFALSRRLNGITPWRWSEAVDVAKILQIPPQEWEEFFEDETVFD